MVTDSTRPGPRQVHFALDLESPTAVGEPQPVCLKFMRNRREFLLEVETRRGMAFEDKVHHTSSPSFIASTLLIETPSSNSSVTWTLHILVHTAPGHYTFACQPHPDTAICVPRHPLPPSHRLPPPHPLPQPQQLPQPHYHLIYCHHLTHCHQLTHCHHLIHC